MIIAKQVISSIIEEKKKNNKEPSIASFTEIQSVVIQSLKSEINELCKTGEIDPYRDYRTNNWAGCFEQYSNINLARRLR